MFQDMFQLLMCPLKPLSVIWQGNVTVTALWSSIFSLAKKKKAGVQEQGMYCGQDDSAYTDAVMEVSSGYVYVLRLMRVIW